MIQTLKVPQSVMVYLSKKDPVLGAFIQQTGSLERAGTVDPYESTLECIIAQQVSTKAAQSISNRFFEKYPIAQPERLLEASLEDLRACGLSGSKAQYLKNIAHSKLSGQVHYENLIHLSTQDVMAQLLPIKGVGRWTVEMVLIFSLLKQDVMSYDDLAIRRGIQRLYHKRVVKPDFFNKLVKRYAPYQTYASFYLWAASAAKENIPFPKD